MPNNQSPQWSMLEAYRCATTAIHIGDNDALANASGHIKALLLYRDEQGAAAWGGTYQAIQDLTRQPMPDEARN